MAGVKASAASQLLGTLVRRRLRPVHLIRRERVPTAPTPGPDRAPLAARLAADQAVALHSFVGGFAFTLGAIL
jgi:hypothetical protein